jgi:hypothetical protein
MRAIHFLLVPKDRKMTREQYHSLRKVMRYMAWKDRNEMHQRITNAFEDTVKFGTGLWKVPSPL